MFSTKLGDYGVLIISINGGILTADPHIRNIWQERVVSYAQFIRNKSVYMQDNVRPHMATIFQEVHVMDWLPKYPILYPIKHIWHELKRQDYLYTTK